MSIKRKIELLLQEIRQATHYSKQNHVDKAWTLIDSQLLEPQAVRVAPEDMPAIGQALFARRGNQSLLCVRSGEKLLTIIDANGHLFTVDLAALEEWIPVDPPTFPKEGS